ncbi:hypothetical protein NQ318_021673 [Aromia moschata]|uniref:PABS domain-containing protein n=1 Tax=Aromia moschata TaxID=1265417 RepID=A0AAV8YE98_9CUCU|nr:hypothetical protein NQ318_021673 [Aromia moschata]
MNRIRDGWFSEISDLWPGQSFSLEVKKVLCEDKSDYQDILVFESNLVEVNSSTRKNNGTVLVLDGIIQCTQKDEFSYQEMISFLPLCAHSNPEKVLIVGGGDGGVAREVDKHPLVKKIVQVEIDRKVIEVSKTYLPFMAKGFASPKLTLENEFDVIITDSSDPIGPAVNLFTESYFQLLKEALKPKGIICSQSGTVWSDLDQAKKTVKNCRKHFKTVKYAISSVPSYPDGQIGYLVAALEENVDLAKPKFKFTETQIEDLKLRYYNDEVHAASFVLPNFAKKDEELKGHTDNFP